MPVCLRIIEQHHEGGHPEIFWLPIESKFKGLSELLDLSLVKVFLRDMIDLNMCGKVSLAFKSAYVSDLSGFSNLCILAHNRT